MSVEDQLPWQPDVEQQHNNNTFPPVLLWVIVLGLMLLFIPLFLLANAISEDVTRLESEVVPLEAALTASPPPPAAAQVLIQTRDDIQSQVDQFTRVAPTLAANQIDWPAAVQAINSYDSAQLTLTSLQQAGNELRIAGRALDDTVVVAYARMLEESGQFSRVVVQSIVVLNETFISPTPSSTATATPLATTTPVASATSTPVPTSAPSTPKPTWTPTPDLRDTYEIDDQHPAPLFLGQAQTRNFYPDFDVDNGVFLAKAGRLYRIQTTGLAPGVDTFLTVTFGDVTLTNDDAGPGTLASEIQLQAPAGSDTEVWVRVTNRGPYGADMQYQLLAQEIVPTPTPTTIPVTPATATPTLAPSATPTATPSPTATPDLRDAYEPDEGNPALIALGEVQSHNFFPFNDWDQVMFPIKNGRHYQVRTADLALGVDTALTVTVGSDAWANDDYDTPGSGNYASAVCFPAAADGTAVAAIHNVSPQYAPDKTYTVSVEEVPQLTLDPLALFYGPVLAGSTAPLTQTVQLDSPAPLEWTASLMQPDETTPGWLSLSAPSGTAPNKVDLFANPTGLPAGTYTATLTIGWSSFCRQAVDVTLQLDSTGGAQPNADTVAQSQPNVAAKRALISQPRNLNQGTAVEFVIVVELRP